MSTTDIGSYVVTGGAHGVGRAIAERLARDGHVVVLDPPATSYEVVARATRTYDVVGGSAGDHPDDDRHADERTQGLLPVRLGEDR